MHRVECAAVAGGERALPGASGGVGEGGSVSVSVSVRVRVSV